MTTLPYQRDILTTNELIWNFLRREDVSEANKLYIKKIFKNIQHWNMAYVLRETKSFNYPLMFVRTNIMESINR